MLRRVEEYAALGAHRTGGPADEPTVAWMAEQLTAAGLSVERRPVRYPGWTGDSRVTLNGASIGHLLVPHGWVGTVATDDVVVGAFNPFRGGDPVVLDSEVASLNTNGRPLVLATEHPLGELVGINRHDLRERWDYPVLLCAGRDADRLRTGPVHVEATGAAHDAEATNLLARNAVGGRPLVLTTPLNGWFTCAGERGTGIAVLLELVQRLADLPLLVLATTGHELGYFGVRDLLPWLHGEELAGVVHVGASIAVVADPPSTEARPLTADRVAMTSLGDSDAGPIAEALAGADLSLATGVEQWLGEATVLCELASPLLSITGAGPDFHTPADTPERATTPDALDRVADALEASCRSLHQYANQHQRTDPPAT